MAEKIDNLRKRAKANGGRLEITPEELKAVGGMQELRKRLNAKPTMLDDFFLSVLKALKPVTEDGSLATVTILADDKEVALGTVVTADGGILTKDSETGKGTITVRLGDDIFPATLVKRFPEWDLALFQIPARDLRPIKFAKNAPPATRGSLLTVPGPTVEPLGIGMVGVTTRPLSRMGYLGIELDRNASPEGRISVRTAAKDSPANKAGLKPDDAITAVNGKPVTDPTGFSRTITSFKPGDTVKLDILRGEETLNLEVKLAERPMFKPAPEFLKVNTMSGPLSPKIDGFPLALQHDIPLEPAQCGGPLLDLEGRCLGINVSRASRVSTLTIPATSIAELLDAASAELSAAAAKAEPEPQVTAEDIAEVTKQLEAIQQRLKQLEKRMEKERQPAGAH
jgi:serine protease Do